MSSGRGDRGDPVTLSSLVGAVRERLRTSAVLAVGAWLGVLVALGLVVAWIVADPEGWRSGSAVPLLLDVGVLVAAAGAVVVLTGRIRRRIADERIADGLDRIGGFGRGTVRSALELSRSAPPGVSAALIRRSEEQVLGGLSRDPASLARPLGEAFRRWSRRGGLALALSVGVLAVLALAGPDRAFSAWGGLLRPASILVTPALPPLSVEPGTDSLPRGSDVALRVQAPGRSQVRVRWQFDGDVARSRDIPVEAGTASASLGILEAPVEYRVEAPDGAATRRFRLIPLDPLLLTDLRVELLFPPHTGLAPRQFQREIPRLQIPVGTRIRIDGRASRELVAASLERMAVGDEPAGAASGADTGEGDAERSASGDAGAGQATEGSGGASSDTPPSGVALTVEEDRFRGEWTPSVEGRYAWRMETGSSGEDAALPSPLEIDLVRDSVPSVALIFPGRDTVLALDHRQPLVIESRDDYGIASLELVARRVSGAGEVDEPRVQALRAGGLRSVMARPVLDVSDWDLIPGDTIRYRVRVTDNGPGAQSAETREFALRVPRRNEAARVVQEELEDVTERVDSLRARAERSARETRELERQGVRQRPSGTGTDEGRRDPSGRRSDDAGQDASFQARESTRQALERQEGLLSQADSVREELERMRRALEEGAVADEELRRDLEELESLMEETASEEMREEGRRISEDLEQMDEGQLEDAVERMAEQQEQLRERIEQSLERFRRAAAEQDFRNTAREARDLAREEEALAEAIEEGDADPRRAEQQAQMAERTRRLQDRMEQLEERLGDLGEEQARQGVQGARQQSEEASRAMERSAQELSREQQSPESSSRAAEEARSAYEDLQQSADALDQSRQQMDQQAQDAQRQALERTASEALALARRQADLQDEIRSRTSEERSRARGDQSAVVEGIENLSENLSRSGEQGQGQDDEEVREALEQARRSAEQVLRSLDDPSRTQPSASQASSETVEQLNQVARAASEATRRQQGGGQQSQQSSGGQTGQQLQQMAERQAGISDQSGAVRSMQLGEASRQRQLRQIAAEQGRLGRELGQMAVRPGTDGQVLGDLRSLAREARSLAREMEGGRLDSEVVRRQERLFHRLLDAGRSLEQDEFSSRREARTAESVEPATVEELTIEDRGGGRFPLPDAEMLRSLPPAQRALVIRYFERLNRSGETADAPASGSP